MYENTAEHCLQYHTVDVMSAATHPRHILHCEYDPPFINNRTSVVLPTLAN